MPSATLAPTTTSSPLAGGELRINPASGPVGTHVLIEGRNCTNSGEQFAELSFENAVGKDALAQVVENAAGYLSYTYVIPGQLEALVGQGSYTVKPGSYEFASHPPYCQASFTVTP